jgi:glycerol-3-phosphate dehydrogenase
MAERVVQAVVELLGRADAASPGRSAERALVGGSAAEQSVTRAQAQSGVDSRVLDRLWAQYGVVAADIAAKIATDPTAGTPVGDLSELTTAEVEHAATSEMVLSLDDLLRRRSRVGMFDIERACRAAPEAASLLARQLGWNAERTATEIDRFTKARTADLAAVRAAGP